MPSDVFKTFWGKKYITKEPSLWFRTSQLRNCTVGQPLKFWKNSFFWDCSSISHKIDWLNILTDLEDFLSDLQNATNEKSVSFLVFKI